MLNKYVELLKKLSDSVFEIKSPGSFSEYSEAVWRGFLLIFLILFTIAGLAVIVTTPFLIWSKVWKRLTKKLTTELTQLFEEGLASNMTRIRLLQGKLKALKGAYISGLCLLHLPIVLPLILMLFDFVF